jgi:hypothetical protein
VKHVEKGYKMEAPEGCPPEVYEIMRQVGLILWFKVYAIGARLIPKLMVIKQITELDHVKH